MASIGQRVGRAYRKLRWEVVRGGPGRTPRLLTVPTANGVLTFSNMDLHSAKGLYVQRAWELDLITRSMEFLRREGHVGRPGVDMLVDVGANIGMICIGMLKHGHFREGVAIEPNPENFALLEHNIAQNEMSDRLRAYRYAASDASGEVEMEISEENFGDHRVRTAQSLGSALMSEEGRRTVRVPARPLDEILRESASVDSKRIGLIWIDIQGYEGHLFRGARDTLGHGMPVLSEFWPYGILRSGLDRVEYAEIIRSLFSRIVIVDAAAGRFEERPASTIEDLFVSYPRPEQNLEIIFLPR